jgi:hypothetical protein
MNSSAFKTNDLALFLPDRLMLRETAEPLFTPIQGNVVQQRQPGNYYNLEINIPFCFCLIALEEGADGRKERHN